MDTDTLQLWPLVLIINDCYDPRHAALVMEVVSEWDSEVCGLTVGCMAEYARWEMGVN